MSRHGALSSPIHEKGQELTRDLEPRIFPSGDPELSRVLSAGSLLTLLPLVLGRGVGVEVARDAGEELVPSTP